MIAKLKSLSNFTPFTELQRLLICCNSIGNFNSSDLDSSLINLDLAYNQLETVNIGDNLSNLQFLYLQNNQLTTLNLGNLYSLKRLWAYDNNLTTINLDFIIISGSINAIRLENNNLSSVNDILIALDNNSNLTSGYCYLNGGTNAAPTGAGITAKNSLITKGWTVTTN
jgi:hypothetical protein